MIIKVYVASLGSGRRHVNAGTHECRAPSSHANLEATDNIYADNPTNLEKNSKIAIDVVRRFAETHDIRYKIFDVGNDWPAFRAWIDGIKVIPTVKIGRKKIEGVPSLNELSSEFGFEHCD